MPWIKLDDSFLTNAKILQAGLEARALYVAGLCYCGKTLSDGAIPAGMVPKLAALADVDDAASAAATLVALGLWHDAPGGFAVHDYLDYNPTRQQAESNAAQRALSGSIGGKRSGEARRERAKQKRSDLLHDESSAATKQTRSKLPSKNEANREAKEEANGATTPARRLALAIEYGTSGAPSGAIAGDSRDRSKSEANRQANCEAKREPVSRIPDDLLDPDSEIDQLPVAETDRARHAAPLAPLAPSPRSRSAPLRDAAKARRAALVAVFEDRLWRAWPVKRNKQQAQVAFIRLMPTDAQIAAMLDAIPAQSAAYDWPRDGYRYCPYLATWLNQRRWEDELGTPPAVDAPGGDGIAHSLAWLKATRPDAAGATGQEDEHP